MAVCYYISLNFGRPVENRKLQWTWGRWIVPKQHLDILEVYLGNEFSDEIIRKVNERLEEMKCLQ